MLRDKVFPARAQDRRYAGECISRGGYASRAWAKNTRRLRDKQLLEFDGRRGGNGSNT